MGFRYNLAQVVINIGRGGDTPIIFGGNKSMLGSITLSRANERFSAEGDATGGFIINENLDKTGEVTISIRQFAPLVNTLTNVFNSYDDGGDYAINTTNAGALTITVMYHGETVAVAKGAFLNMSELGFEEEAGDRDFTFVAGEVEFETIPEAGRIV